MLPLATPLTTPLLRAEKDKGRSSSWRVWAVLTPMLTPPLQLLLPTLTLLWVLMSLLLLPLLPPPPRQVPPCGPPRSGTSSLTSASR